MNRDSLLPKSLFSASTLKREPVHESPNEVEHRQQATRRVSRSSDSAIEIPSKRRSHEEPESHVIDDDDTHTISSSSSSSSSEEEEDLDLRGTRSDDMSIAHVTKNTNQLLLKLERQQSKQNKYLSKLKHIHKSIRNTSRLLGYNANLISELTNQPVESSSKRPVKVTEEPKQKRQRRLIRPEVDEDDDDLRIIDEPPPPPRPRMTHDPKPKQVEPEPRPKQPAPEPRARQPAPQRVRRAIKEIELGTSDRMDTFTIRKKQNDIVFGKKPRSLLCNIAEPSSELSELMVTTSLDGDLQFWNSRSRKNIKTIGKSHIYEKWIEDICWATSSTLAFSPPQKTDEPVKLVHIGKVTRSNVEGRIQSLNDDPHENGISTIAAVDTGSFTKNGERCSFVTGGFDKTVYLWTLRRDRNGENFSRLGCSRLNIKHTSAVYCLFHDKFRNTLFSGGADERFVMHDMQTDTTLRELRLTQRVSHIMQSKVNPNLMLVTVTARSEQFMIYDIRSPQYEGIKLKFGQVESETLSRYIAPDMHDNGYTVACGSSVSSKMNFWDIRYTGVSRNTSFTLDMTGSIRNLRTLFIPNTDTIASIGSNRSMTWLDYGVERDVLVRTIA